MKMKKLLIALLLLSTIQLYSQTLYVCQPTGYASVSSSSVGNMTYSSNGSILSIGGTDYQVSDIDSIVFTQPAKTVYVDFTDGAATIKNYTGGVVKVLRNTNGHVALYSYASESGITDEVNYIVSGSGNNNSLYIEGDYKLTLTLNGVTLNNPDSAAIRVRCGKRIAVKMLEGTTNTLTDGTTSAHDACFWIKGHAEFDGLGTLNLEGNYHHAFKCGEYCQLKKGCGTINVTKALGDGIHCGEHFQMNDGTVNISGTYGDGIDPDDLGNVIINGGKVTVTVDSILGKGIKCDSTYTQNGGSVKITLPAAMLSSRGIDIGKNGFLNDGTIDVTVNANGAKGIKGSGNFTQAGGTITMDCSGGKDKVTDPEDTSKCYGIKLDGTWKKTGGTCKITTTSSVSAAIKDISSEYDYSGVVISK
jgi:hypothetical protein